MSKTYLPYDPDQQLLLPAALQEWMPQDHLAYFISDVVDQLDLSAITARDEDEKRGPSLPSQDDGESSALRLLHRCGIVPSHRPTAPRGHRLPGAGSQPAQLDLVGSRTILLQSRRHRRGQVLAHRHPRQPRPNPICR